MKDKHYSKDLWKIKNSKRELNRLMSNPKIIDILRSIKECYLIADESFSFLTYGAQGVLFKGFSSAFESDVCIKVPFYNSYEHDHTKESDLLKEAQNIIILPQNECDYYPKLFCYDRNGKFLIKKYYDFPELYDLILADIVDLQALTEALIKHFGWLMNAYKQSLHETVILCDYKALNLLFNQHSMTPMFVDLGNIKTLGDIHLDRLAVNKKIGSRRFLHWPPELLIGDANYCGTKCNEFILGVLLYFSVMHKYPYQNDESLESSELYHKYDIEYNEAYRYIREHPNFNKITSLQRDIVAGCINPHYSTRLTLL